MTPAQAVHLEAMERDAMSRHYDNAEDFLKGWRVMLGLSGEQHLDMARVLQEAASDAELYPEVMQALAGTRKLARVALLSNTQSYDLEFLDHLGLSELLPNQFLSAETGALKPELGAFEAVQRHMGLFPGELAMVGDSWHSDIQGALAVGWTALWVNRDGKPRPEHPQEAELVEVQDLSQVPAAIAALQAGARCGTCLG
jgi:putative hydrolase of the HAD superfamily